MKQHGWLARLSGLAWVIFCFEIGIILVVYPWLPGWDTNWLAGWRPDFRPFWLNPYLRGAVTGLGAVNIAISLAELYRILREWLFEQ